jgi:hypothetical protein
MGLRVVACNFFLSLPIISGVVGGDDNDDDLEGVVVVEEAATVWVDFGEADHFLGRLALNIGVWVEA